MRWLLDVFRQAARRGAVRSELPNGLPPCFVHVGGGRGLEENFSSHRWIMAVVRRALVFVAALAASASVSAQDVITTAAGNGTFGFSGDNGPAVQASLSYPAAIAVDLAGNLFTVDQGNNRIRKVALDGTITTVAGNGSRGFSTDGGPATAAALASPSGIAVDAFGNLYIADTGSYRIRKVGADGIIRTVAGTGSIGFSGDGGAATEAALSICSGLAVDADGNLYIADQGNARIRKVSTAGIITTVAGNGTVGFSGDGGNAVAARLGMLAVIIDGLTQASGIAVDAAGNLYIAEIFSNRIRKVDADGKISTIAGTGVRDTSGDGGPALLAALDQPMGVAVDAAGNLYIAHPFSHLIRKIDPDGFISTVAGTGVRGYVGDNRAALAERLNFPFHVAIEATGVFFIADKLNHRVRKVQPTPQVTADPASLDFQATAGAGSPPAQMLNITNAASGRANWTYLFATPGGGNWLSLSPSSGTTPTTVTVTVNTSGFLSASYRGTIVLAPTAGLGDAKLVPVTLTVTPAPTIALSPTKLSFSGMQGANPPTQTVALSNLGGGTLLWTAAAGSTSGNWLSVTPASGTGAATLTVAANTAGLSLGSYSGTVRVTATGATNTPQSVDVTLTVTPSVTPTITLSPGSLQFLASAGASPAPQTFQIQNTGTGILDWTAAAATQSGGNWLAVNPTSGTAPSMVSVMVTSTSLAAGVYTGSIIISAPAGSNTTNSPQTLPVALAVGAPLVGPNGIVNGASFSTDAIVSPGSIASMFGVNLAASTVVAGEVPLPTTLAGTQVLVNNVAAPLFFVLPGQINFQVPAEASGSAVPVVVVSGGVRGNTVMLRLAPEVPGIFSAAPAGRGQGAILNQDNTLNSAQNPAEAGSVIQIFATGLGATNPPLATGQPGAATSPFNETVQSPVVLIGGAAAEVLFSAVAPNFVGLNQVNARVPAGTSPGGAVSLQMQLSGRSSNTVTVAVR